MKEQRKYMVWKTDPKGEPIEGTDRTMLGSSRKSVVKYLAHEEGVDYKEGDIFVRCKDGSIWFVRYFSKVK